jgi:hypothetical protein
MQADALEGLRITAQRFLSVARCAHRDFWFGKRKVFLAGVADLSDPEVLEMLDACRLAQLLVFARADLVAAMDSDLVEESVWQIDGAQFHFLVVA